MKSIKVIGAAMLMFVFAGNTNAQRITPKSSNNSSATTTVSVDQEYFTDVKTLSTYFVGHKIPSNFPKYDGLLGEDGNAKAALMWTEIPENYALLSAAGIKKLEEYKSEMENADKKK